MSARNRIEKGGLLSNPVLITGGTQRIGLAIAENLLAQDIPVIVTYRRFKPTVKQLTDAGAVAMEADFSTQAGIARAIEEIKHNTPALRGVIHNASDWESESQGAPAEELFQRMMMVHASAPYQLNLALTPLLLNNNNTADIIHMTDYVQEAGSQKHIAYAASKAALHNLTLSFARQLAPQIKVNSIAPSLLVFNDGDSEAYKQKSLNKSLMGIEPGANEAVEAVNYLFGSAYVTGQTLHLNGGRNLKAQ